MELVHRFQVPVPVGEAWTHFNDISSVAECFPGATLSSADDEGFTGSVKVRLGPIALLYNGSGTFAVRDEDAHLMRIEAKGKDKRGNGTAAAQVVLTMVEAGGATDVQVTTELSVTGKPAQFGRGVMQDVSDKLLAQFVACLEQRYAAGPEPSLGPSEPSEPSEPSRGPSEPSEPSRGPAGDPTGVTAGVPTGVPVGGPPPAAAPAAGRTSPPTGADSVDLGRTVLPVLARSYGPWALAAVALLVAWRCCRRG